MATSPIYNWPEPDNTDLVKNGALAIRTLGNAIDTTMATMTPKSLVDAKGDLVTATANDTPARLAVGADGSTLVANSAASTGLSWQGSTAAGRNFLINGGFDIWQRGTSFTGLLGNAYGADRWMFNNTTGRTYSRQSSGLDGFQYCLRSGRDSGQTSTNAPTVVYSNESVNSIPLQGKTVTLSYYARKGANFSAASDALAIDWKTGTGTDQNVYTAGYTGSVSVINTTVTLTTSWQRFSHTFSFASNATEVGGFFSYTPVGTAGANDYFEMTGVQLEVGSIPTGFTRAGGTIQGELAACQRYYYRQTAFSAFGPMLQGFETGSTSANGYFNLPVTLRTTPTAVDFSTLFVNDQGGNITITGITIGNSSQNLVNLSISAASGMVAGRPFQLLANNSTTAFLGVAAEL